MAKKVSPDAEAIPNVRFLDWDCRVVFEKYTNGRTALVLHDARDGEEVAVATVNVPEAQLGQKEVLIKDYSENQGMLAALQEAGIVRNTGRAVQSGFATIPVCELLVSPQGEGRGSKRPSVAEGTSVLEHSPMAGTREELIRETFELSREIGYAHFLAENFDRPDPVLVRLGAEERKAFLREWWDAARDRMYESYLEQVAGMSNEDLVRNRQAYQEVLAFAGTTGSSRQTPVQPPAESPRQTARDGRKDDIRGTLRDMLADPKPEQSSGNNKQSQRTKEPDRGH